MHQIIIQDPLLLRDIIDFAQTAGCAEQLAGDLLKLFQVLTIGMHADDPRPADTMTAEVWKDFAPYSLRFLVKRNNHVLLNGGWIYAGPGSPGDGSAPALSVNLNWVMGNAPTHSWSVHT
jgi:hypothetical protein